MSKKIDFIDITDEQIKNDAKGISGGSNLLTLAEGETLVRIMPPWAAGKRYYKAYKMHFGLSELLNYGLEVDGWFNSPCLADVEGKCPICAIANKAKATGTRNGDTALLELSKQIRAKQQYVANVVNMDKVGEGVKILPFGKKVFEDLQSLFSRKGNVTHPITGFNLVIAKREIPNQRWFDYSVSLDEKADISDMWESFSKQIHDLDNFPQLPSYEEVSRKLEGIELVAPATFAKPAASDSAVPGYTPSRAPRSSELDDILGDM